MATNVKLDNTRLEQARRRVTFTGLGEVMFDRYAGDNKTRLEWSQKIYLGTDSKTVCLPALNIMSLLTAHNTNSAPKRLRDKREYKDLCNACLSFLLINPGYIPFTRNGKTIEVGKFEADRDPKSGMYLHRAVARLDKGIPNPKERPVLPLPWELSFDLTILPNKEIQEQEIVNLLQDAGRAIGIGTWRGLFGKFSVTQWDEI